MFQVSAGAVQTRMCPIILADLNAAPCRGVAQRPIGIRGISMRSLSGFRNIRRACRRTGMQRSGTERDTLGTWMRLNLGRESRSYGRVASFPVFDPFPRGRIRVYHLFLPLLTSRHLLLLFHEFNRLHSPPHPNPSLKRSTRLRGEERRRV